MKKKIIFMFSGQGSQYYHMGKELYENHGRFKFWMDYCDDIAYPLVRASLVDVLYKGKGKIETFDQICYTNPALLSIQYSLARVILEMNVHPDYLLGYSLGEITASVVAGVLSLEQGMQMVTGMAELVEAGTQPAGMLAIIESPEIMLLNSTLFKNCWLTGVNFQRNFVVSGLKSDIQYLQEALKGRDILCQLLPVKYGFHTKLIDPVRTDFKRMVRKIGISPGIVPVISALKTNIVQDVSGDYYWEVIRNLVAFEKTVHRTLQKGDFLFVDLAPSGSLATFVKYILPQHSGSIALQVLNQFGNDMISFEKLCVTLSSFY